MATKPTGADTVPLWASNANWSAGPSIGLANKWDPSPFAANGHIEGVTNPTDSRTQNGWQNRVSKWSIWVELGSSAGAADAHIVETSSLGKTVLQALDIIGSTPVAGPALSVTQGSSGSPTGYFARNSSDPAEAVVSIGGSSASPLGVDVQTAVVPAFRALTSGGAPLHLGVQFATIPLPGTNTGAIWFPREGDVTALRAAAGNRTWVQSLINQHVRMAPIEAGPVAITPISTFVSIFAASALPSTNAVISAMTLEVTITMTVDTFGGGAADLQVRLKNLGVVKFTAPVHVEANIQDSKVVRRALIVVAGVQSIDLDIAKSTAGVVSVSDVIMTVETMY